MCGRYTFYTDKELKEVDEIIQQISEDIQREKNQQEKREMKTGEIFPTNLVPILLPSDQHQPMDYQVQLQTWGFPNFAGKGVIINARSETAREKPLFRSSLAKRRCVIPSTGFFEWDRDKRKYLFRLPEEGMLYLAGLYNLFEGEERFVILTTAANESIADVHHRMPVVLNRQEIKPWLQDPQAIDDILMVPRPLLERTGTGPSQISFFS